MTDRSRFEGGGWVLNILEFPEAPGRMTGQEPETDLFPGWLEREFSRMRSLPALYRRREAWLLLADMLKKETEGASLEDLRIVRDPKGKPVSMARPGLYFNISHCPCACSSVISGRPVGTDVERPFPVRENLIRRVCCEKEKALLSQCSSFDDKSELFRIIWSVKESILKMTGNGLAYGMERLDLVPFLTGWICQKKTGGDLPCKDLITGPSEWIPDPSIGPVSIWVRVTERYTAAVAEKVSN